jgi:type II secretory ATPase GspE/PulE/Tfp pilus assembly ATPase PilB-like protein
MFLCCGPTGSGKTTTLYACLREIDRFQKNIITVEDPIEYHLDNITQMEINTKSGQTFAGSLRSILRQDPDVIMIGEIRDQETATIACQAATTGHMVFSTVHANDTVTALFRLLDLGVEPFMIASALTAVLGQRLVRVLCEGCKEPYKPKPEFLKKANLPADKVEYFYRRPTEPQQVCPQCGGTGYLGRTGIFELLVLTDAMRDMIRENPSINAIKAEARKNGMFYLQEDGLRQVIQGKTSIDELLRVVK